MAGWSIWSPHGWVMNVVTTWLGDQCSHHMPGSLSYMHKALHLPDDFSGVRLCTVRSLYKSPLDETIYLSCVYPCKTITHTHTHTHTHIYIYICGCQKSTSSVDYRNTKNNPACTKYRRLQSVKVRHLNIIWKRRKMKKLDGIWEWHVNMTSGFCGQSKRQST